MSKVIRSEMQNGLWSRRSALGLCAALPISPNVWRAVSAQRGALRHVATTPPPFSNRPRLLVGGAQDGELGSLAATLRSRLNAALPPNQSLRLDHIGGADGVTAANQFEANVAPDGETGLIISGAAALAWLCGDPRAQFDVGHWLPIATADAPGVVIVANLSALNIATPRLMIETGPSPALPAQLGLYLLNGRLAQVLPSADALQSLANGDADAVFLLGPTASRRAAEAVGRGMIPLFSLGSLVTADQFGRDPFLPDVPTLPELLATRKIPANPALLKAWRSAAAASRLDVAVLLPWLTPANVVAWWRTLIDEAKITDITAASDNITWHTNPTGNFGLNAIIAGTDTSLALHRWLANPPV